jgi:hypothetical protein
MSPGPLFPGLVVKGLQVVGEATADPGGTRGVGVWSGFAGHLRQDPDHLAVPDNVPRGFAGVQVVDRHVSVRADHHGLGAQGLDRGAVTQVFFDDEDEFKQVARLG